MVEEAFSKCYAPFLKTLARFPSLKTVVHFSGPLLEWIDQREPEFLSGLRRLLREGRVEILGGGFYEPILSLIPEIDRLEQIELMTHFCDRMLGVRPRGFWLTERVWEPQFPTTLQAAQIDYTFLDDQHLLKAGIAPENMGGSYLTEDQGARLRIFPLDQALRYAIPFKTPEEVMALLHDAYEQGTRQAVTVIDDAEKFGLWPGTYKTLYGENWLARFFTLLVEAQNDWLNVTTPMSYNAGHAPRGLVYMPSSGYPEIESWARGEEFREGVEGPATSFKRFFMRYPRSQPHAQAHARHLGQGPPKQLRRPAARSGQTRAVSRTVQLRLLARLIRRTLLPLPARGGVRASAQSRAFGRCGQRRRGLRPRLRRPKRALPALPRSCAASCCPRTAACSASWTTWPRPPTWPTSWPATPSPITTGPSAPASSTRSAWGFSASPYTSPSRSRAPDDLLERRLPELCGLGEVAYAATPIERENESGALLRGTVCFDERRLDLTKRITLDHAAPRLHVAYTWALQEGGPLRAAVAIRLDLSLPSALGLAEPFLADGQVLPGVSLLSSGRTPPLRRFSVRDPHHQLFVHLDLGEALPVWQAPLFTCSRSERGLERQCQALCLWLIVPLSLDAGQERGFTVCLEVEHDARRG